MSENSWTSISSSHLFFTKIIGLIPFNKDKTLGSSSNRLCSFLCHIMNLYNSLRLGYGIKSFPELEVGYMCEMVMVQGVFFRYLVLYANRTKITKLLDKCRELWSFLRNDENRVVRVYERKAYNFRNIIMIDGMMLTSFYIATTFLNEIPVAEAHNVTKELTFRYWADVHEEPTWTIVTVWYCAAVYYIPIETAGLEAVCLFFIMMASGYLRVIQERLFNLYDRFDGKSDDNNVLYDEVLECVQYHQKIVLFCEDIDFVTRKAFLVIILTSSYNLSIVAFKLLDQNDQVVMCKYVTLLLFNLFPFFTAQYGPEYLLNESEAIGDAAYFASLRQSTFDPKTNKMLLFVMMRSQRPIQLTAGGFIQLSIESFEKMLQSAFSLFTALRSLNK